MNAIVFYNRLLKHMEIDSDLKTKLHIAKLATKSFDSITLEGILPDDPEIVYRPLKLLQEILSKKGSHLYSGKVDEFKSSSSCK